MLVPLAVWKLNFWNVVLVPNTPVGFGRLLVNVVEALDDLLGQWPMDSRSSQLRPGRVDRAQGRKPSPFMMIGSGLPPATATISSKS